MVALFWVTAVMASAFWVHLAKGSGLTKDEKNIFINKHSDERKLVNVDELIWDEAIAKQALEYGKLCLWKHSKIPKFGENLAMGIPELEARNAVGMWNYEKYFIINGKCVNSPFGTCGHYTQMVRAANKRFGCAKATCSDWSNGRGGDYFVCQYSKSSVPPLDGDGEPVPSPTKEPTPRPTKKPTSEPTPFPTRIHEDDLPTPNQCLKKDRFCAELGEEHKKCKKFIRKCERAIAKQIKKNRRGLFSKERALAEPLETDEQEPELALDEAVLQDDGTFLSQDGSITGVL